MLYKLFLLIRFYSILLVGTALLFPSILGSLPNTEKSSLPKKPRHQIQIKVTFQEPDYRTPWRSKNPGIRFGTGTYLGGTQVLLPASILSNHTLIEGRSLEEPSSITGRVWRLDSESDLAIIDFEKPGNLFLGIQPVEFPNRIFTRTTAEIIRIDATGEPSVGSSRLENLLVGLYPEGQVELPYVEVTSNEKLSGNGELLRTKDGIPIGILNEFTSGSGRGRIIPSEIIHGFLKDKKVFAAKGFLFRPITDPITSSYYKIPSGKNGIIVTDVFLGGSADGILKPEDVITEVGDLALDGKGRVTHPIYGKVSFAYLLNDPHTMKLSLGDRLRLQVLRGGKSMNLDLILKPFSEESIFIPHGRDTKDKPGYLVTGGFVILELSEFYLKEFGRAWRSNVDKKMLYMLDYHKYRTSKDSLYRPVYIMQVLPDEGNNGYHGIRGKRVLSMNGVPVKDLQDLYERTKNILQSKDKSGLQEWILELEDGTIVALTRDRILDLDKRIQENYSIPELYSP